MERTIAAICVRHCATVVSVTAEGTGGCNCSGFESACLRLLSAAEADESGAAESLLLLARSLLGLRERLRAVTTFAGAAGAVFLVERACVEAAAAEDGLAVSATGSASFAT